MDFGPSAAIQDMQQNSDKMANQIFMREPSLYRH
jgi:hypothetical protein